MTHARTSSSAFVAKLAIAACVPSKLYFTTTPSHEPAPVVPGKSLDVQPATVPQTTGSPSAARTTPRGVSSPDEPCCIMMPSACAKPQKHRKHGPKSAKLTMAVHAQLESIETQILQVTNGDAVTTFCVAQAFGYMIPGLCSKCSKCGCHLRSLTRPWTLNNMPRYQRSVKAI